MLGRERATTADAIEAARQTGNITALLLFQRQLADWDRIIARLREDAPPLGRGSDGHG
jgi:hypothetical protein